MSEEIQFINFKPTKKANRIYAKTASKLFDNAYEMYQIIEKTNPLLHGLKMQSDIKQAIRWFEDATRFISILHCYKGDCKYIEEISITHVKYLLMPALLGILTNKIWCNKMDRLHLVKIAEIYFVDFLRRMLLHDVIKKIPEFNSIDESQYINDSHILGATRKMLEDMEYFEIEKIAIYREESQYKYHLKTLKQYLDYPKIGQGQIDQEQIKMNYFKTLFSLFVARIAHELFMLRKEKSMLEQFEKIGPILPTSASESQETQKHIHSAPKLLPVLITRLKMQKIAVGVSYQHISILTFEEFYEKRIKDGDWPAPWQFCGTTSRWLHDSMLTKYVLDNRIGNEEDSEAILEKKIEEKDDPEYLERIRVMDELCPLS